MNIHYIIAITATCCLAAVFPSMAQAAVCDVDKNGSVNRLDISLIIASRDKPASGPGDPRDANGDGTISVIDARSCVQLCKLPNCAIAAAPPPPSAIGTGWKVKRGDTLYSIGRAVFPESSSKQAGLRADIIKLNPAVFANGANNMSVGIVLKLPAYVAGETATAKAGDSAATPKPAPVKVTPKPVAAVPIVQPQPPKPQKVEPAQAATTKPEPIKQATTRQPTAQKPRAPDMPWPDGNFLASFGFSYGGHELLNSDGLLNFTAGSGFHARVGYEQMPKRGGGYRVALGLQYNTPYDDLGGTAFSDTYLQVAYQERQNPWVYGIGLVLDSGASLENGSRPKINYDSAIGAVVYLENIGKDSLAGWGVSYTSLTIDEKGSSRSVGASRVEVNYNWKF